MWLLAGERCSSTSWTQWLTEVMQLLKQVAPLMTLTEFGSHLWMTLERRFKPPPS